ncbi:MAG: HEAT repeat domain-containing protein [bacterium]|nr:HEAT repeat domain-containing protein [bacterium]
MRNTTAVVFAFAALQLASPALPQGQKATPAAPSAPKAQLGAQVAAAVAVEEQEGDLARAEKLYRSALATDGISAADRAYTNLRLGLLLQRLGRKGDAAPFLQAAVNSKLVDVDAAGGAKQDVERQKQLRVRARKLLEQMWHFKAPTWHGPLPGIEDPELARQLLWIGEAAVPEVIARLQKQETTTVSDRSPLASAFGCYVAGLAGFLWRVGGQSAADYLAAGVSVENEFFRQCVALSAFQAESEPMVALATRYLADASADAAVNRAVLTSKPQRGKSLGDRLDPDRIVNAALEGPPSALLAVFSWARNPRTLSSGPLAALHERVRRILQSTNPELASAALQFLTTRTSQQSTAGVELLLANLLTVPTSFGLQTPDLKFGRFTAEEARRLVPAVDACVQRMGRFDAEISPQRERWLSQMATVIAVDHGPGCEAQVIDWINRGASAWEPLRGRVTDENAVAIAKLVSGSKHRIYGILDILAGAKSLPREVFPVLRERAAANREEVPGSSAYAWPMALTGHPEAPDWIFTMWQKQPKKDWAARALVELGRHDRSESVRRALRGIASESARSRNPRPLLALMAMGDIEALDLIRPNMSHGSVRHPYAETERVPSITPIQYLLYGPSSDYPPHGYTPERVEQAIVKVTEFGFGSALFTNAYSLDLIPDRNFIALASRALAIDDMKATEAAWVSSALERWAVAEPDSPQKRVFTSWIAGVLRESDSRPCHRLIHQLSISHIEPFRAAIEALLDSPSAQIAKQAARLLVRSEDRITKDLLERLVRNPAAGARRAAIEGATALGAKAESVILPLLGDTDTGVRHEAAQFFGQIVSKRAVPQLIALLRDEGPGVRTVAAESLTRIRFYHEQQAHWDRVLKGLDASPASAAEKLLLQSKPGHPKKQRLLAIKSLGVLGAPEALPFLIDWSAEKDAEVAAAATAAITRIHLRAGK